MVLQLSSECNYISAYGARAKSLADGGGILLTLGQALPRSFERGVPCVFHKITPKLLWLCGSL